MRHTLGFALTLISTRRCAHTRNQISMLKSGKTMKRISITCDLARGARRGRRRGRGGEVARRGGRGAAAGLLLALLRRLRLLLLLLLLLLLPVLLQRAVDTRHRVADPLLRRVVGAGVERLEKRAHPRHEPLPLPPVGVALRDLALLLRRVVQTVEPDLELMVRHLRLEPGSGLGLAGLGLLLRSAANLYHP